MGNGVKVRMSRSGSRELLGSRTIALDLGERAKRICDRANSMTSEDEMFNEAFEYDVKAGGSRARASVVTATPHGARHNARHNTLLKALGAGR